MPDDDDEHEPRRRRNRRNEEFTPEQRERILRMLEDHERARWVVATIAVFAKWVAQVGAGSAIILASIKFGLGELAKWRP